MKQILVIDSFDLINYCFPAILRKDIDYEDFIEKRAYFWAYAKMFENQKNLFTFEEYIFEFNHYVNNITGNYNSYNSKFNTIGKSFSIEDFYITLSFFYGSDKTNNEVVNRLENIANINVNLIEVNEFNEQENKLLNKLIIDSNSNIDIEKCYKAYIEFVSILNNKNLVKNSSTLVDIYSIERIKVINDLINLEVEKGELPLEVEFAFFSSANFKTPKICSILNSLTIRKSGLPKHLNYIPLSSINHFKSELFSRSENQVANYEEWLKAIKLLKEKNIFDTANNPTQQLIYKEHQKFRQTKNEESKVISQLFNKLESLNSSFVTKNQILLHSSMDAVKSYTQSFPILLFDNTLYKDQEYCNFILNLISPYDYEKINGLLLKQSKLNILNILKYLSKNEFFIFKCFIDLILGSRNIESSYEDKLPTDYKENEILNDSLLLFSKAEETSNRLELFYFNIFLFRRMARFNDAFEFLKANLGDEFILDHYKIKHAIGLLYCSAFYNILDEINKPNVLNAYANISRTQKKQLKFYMLESKHHLVETVKNLKELEKEKSSKIYSHIKIAIQNTICDIYAQAYWFSFNFTKKSFTRANNKISSIKSDFHKHVRKPLGNDYYSYTAYNHTEFDLELCELNSLISENKTNEAKLLIKRMKLLLKRLHNENLLENHSHLSNFSHPKFEELRKKVTI